MKSIAAETAVRQFVRHITGKRHSTPGATWRAGTRPVDTKKQRTWLGELLAQCKPSARRSREDRDWLASPPAGRELI